MKNKKKIVTVIAAIGIILLIAGTRYTQFRSLKNNMESVMGIIKGSNVGNMNINIKEPENHNSSIGIEGEEGDKFKVIFEGSTKEGSAVIKILNGDKVEEEVKLNDSGKIEFQAQNNKGYSVVVSYNNFVGTAKVKVYKET